MKITKRNPKKTYIYDIRITDNKKIATVNTTPGFQLPTVLEGNTPEEAILTFHLNRKPTETEIKKFNKHNRREARKRADQILADPLLNHNHKTKKELSKKFREFILTTSTKLDKVL